MSLRSVQQYQHCAVTGKLRYPTKELSDQECRRIEREERDGIVRRSYQCEHCGDWEITRYENHVVKPERPVGPNVRRIYRPPRQRKRSGPAPGEV